MKKRIYLIFFLMILVYCTGILVGSVREIKMPQQSEIYEYLEKSVSDYDLETKECMKSVALDNIKSLVFLGIGGFFKPISWIIAFVMLARGYAAGFSIMAALRLYGIKGIVMCGANLISAAITVPAISCYASMVFEEMFVDKLVKRERIKRTTIILVLLIAILCADCVIKGFFSPIFMRWIKN